MYIKKKKSESKEKEEAPKMLCLYALVVQILMGNVLWNIYEGMSRLVEVNVTVKDCKWIECS